MELRELRYFRTILDCGSFSRAAIKLNVAQPSLSRQIQALEQELGLPLLHRNARGVTPTEAGQMLLMRVARLENEAEDIKRALTQLTTSVTGTLRVAVQAPVSFLLLPELIKAYARLYPDVRIQLTEAYSGDVVDKLLSAAIDIAIVDMPRTPSAELNVMPIWVEKFRLFGRADAAAVVPGGRDAVPLSEIANLPFISTSPHHAMRHLVQTAFERRGLVFNPVLEANGPLMIFELVRAGLGYTIMPLTAFTAFRDVCDLGSIAIKPEILRTMTLTTRAAVSEDRAIASFSALAQTLIPQLAENTRFGPISLYQTSRSDDGREDAYDTLSRTVRADAHGGPSA